MRMLVLVATAACSPVMETLIGGDVYAEPDAQTPEDPPALLTDSAPPPTPTTEMEDAAMPPPTCTAGLADCDGDASNGCEADLASDPRHCGSCGTACQSADCACQDGVLVTQCASGRADCDGDVSTGCETDLMTDMRNCGDCDQRCHAEGFAATSATCEQGSCRITCQRLGLREDCDGDPDNGCEAELWEDPDNCGVCGRSCQICNDGRCL